MLKRDASFMYFYDRSSWILIIPNSLREYMLAFFYQQIHSSILVQATAESSSYYNESNGVLDPIN